MNGFIIFLIIILLSIIIVGLISISNIIGKKMIHERRTPQKDVVPKINPNREDIIKERIKRFK
jgi:hypothetical protein